MDLNKNNWIFPSYGDINDFMVILGFVYGIYK